MVTVHPSKVYVENERISEVARQSSTPVSMRIYPIFWKKIDIEERQS